MKLAFWITIFFCLSIVARVIFVLGLKLTSGESLEVADLVILAVGVFSALATWVIYKNRLKIFGVGGKS